LPLARGGVEQVYPQRVDGGEVAAAGDRHLAEPPVPDLEGVDAGLGEARLAAAGEVLAERLGDFPQHVVLAGFGELLPQGPGVVRGQRLEDVADLAAAQPVQQVLDLGQVGAVHHGFDELLAGHALAMHHAFHEALFAQELGDLFEGHSLGGSQGRLEKKTGQAARGLSPAAWRGGGGQAAHDLQREGSPSSKMA
jgi:hypothetical protein